MKLLTINQSWQHWWVRCEESRFTDRHHPSATRVLPSWHLTAGRSRRCRPVYLDQADLEAMSLERMATAQRR